MLDDIVDFVGKLVQRQIVAHSELKLLDSHVTAESARAMFKGAAISEAGREELRALDAELAEAGAALAKTAALTQDTDDEHPLVRLRRIFELTGTEERVLWIALVAELQPRVRALLRFLSGDPTRDALDVGLLEVLVYSAPSVRARLVEELGPESRLVRLRLIDIVPSDRGGFLARRIRVSSRLIELGHGVLGLDRSLARCATLVSPRTLDDLLVGDDLRARLQGLLAESLRGGPGVFLVGRPGAGRRSLAIASALALGFDSLLVACQELPLDGDAFEERLCAVMREAQLLRAMPVFLNLDVLAVEGGPTDRPARLNRVLRDWSSGFLATGTPGESLPVMLDRGLVRVPIPTLPEPQRLELWRRELAGVAAPELDLVHVAGRYASTAGTLLRSAAAARAIAAARNEPVNADDIHEGLRAVSDEHFGLGTRVTRKQTWADVVLPPDVMDSLREFIARIRHRRRVYEDWGFGKKMARGLGVSALFAGVPGTGKTMVAGIIADELGLDLYQIDLSRVVSKYIGETEKNLGRLFDAAETGHAILLFDEADALFAKRGEVKSSIDRYANMEVNYLLQRMESFDGITILTTNLASSLDDAFRRRLSLKLEFPLPEAEERKKLWAAMIPDPVIRQRMDFTEIARRFEMSGGYIRNAVLRAAFMAAAADRELAHADIVRAAELEYAAMGKIA